MVTEAQALRVLKKSAERLRKQGAHALSVRPGVSGAFIRALLVPGEGRALPKTVSATVQGKRVRVPLQTEEQEKFQAERL